ncbi:cobyrinate a,c-diamide synthase [Paenibacillus marchantiophytorum]|uniref:Cobyrinate a,c-diamide synthase n=1 Tax=Paenibacillus marchantiophytorum TaxID=1619310 RepID=A0ABQ1F4L1_9BACL|nr:cobyrinate a,c-diamide synthase [Paenibacillus marchantiophytorum]GFZ99211.1 cobyrinate a,c-diamide synthase [Paenibacillus marchantiophytorum]
MARRLVIAGTGSGVGKTTITIGIMAALQKRGLAVQGFKCGPDYIDPTYHTAVTGRASRNLDSWMVGRDAVKEIFQRGSLGADISLIEGVMGMFDGKDPLTDEGSTADIGRILDSPVVLVVNIASMARSVAAIVKGFQQFGQGDRIVGVIANRAGSESHYKMVKQAIEQECGIPVFGYLPKDVGMELPERHLGLVPSIGRGEFQPFFNHLAEKMTAHLNLDLLLAAAEAKQIESQPSLFKAESAPPTKRVKIAIAKDAAFHFYYPENIELLEASGAECLYFSPLAGEEVPPEADGLYIGGGFPEEFAARLAADEPVKLSVRNRIQEGIPTLAECGGYMYLTDQIVDTTGNAYPMVGIVPGTVTMQKKLAALGYREVTGTEGNFLLPAGQQARGHEFHYSTLQLHEQAEVQPAFWSKGRLGTKAEGIVQSNVVAGYTHLHFASNPDIVQAWIQACVDYQLHMKHVER